MKRSRRRLAGAVLAVGMAAVGLVVPLGNVAAVAQPTENPHWGISPYYPECVEGPCRVVIIADKTGNPQFATQIQRWAAWMNFARTTYNLQLPAFGYVQLNDPSCAVADGVISVCRSNQILIDDCPGEPTPIRCTQFTMNLASKHFGHVRSVFSEQPVADPDAWSLVCAALGRSIGMLPSEAPDSCLQPSITLGTGQEKYYAISDWLSLFATYAHPANE
ncbi:MAG TPA: hypothetical protein VM390_01760 [Acidimicrobiales bacterium]|nr:hypothetical protein [Acidimicrobiales bacterium]